MNANTILWRRLDTPGHDACRLSGQDSGWRLEGAAVFRHDDRPACLAYVLDCDDKWQTQQGTVRGWLGSRPVKFRIARTPDGDWTLNGRAVLHLGGCVDLDLGFTPATNLFQIRRLALDVGQRADVPVAWLDASAGALERLEQRYERHSAEVYWYEAPRFNYAALLQVSAVGFVYRYPQLWEAEQ